MGRRLTANEVALHRFIVEEQKKQGWRSGGTLKDGREFFILPKNPYVVGFKDENEKWSIDPESPFFPWAFKVENGELVIDLSKENIYKKEGEKEVAGYTIAFCKRVEAILNRADLTECQKEYIEIFRSLISKLYQSETNYSKYAVAKKEENIENTHKVVCVIEYPDCAEDEKKIKNLEGRLTELTQKNKIKLDGTKPISTEEEQELTQIQEEYNKLSAELTRKAEEYYNQNNGQLKIK